LRAAAPETLGGVFTTAGEPVCEIKAVMSAASWPYHRVVTTSNVNKPQSASEIQRYLPENVA
jgi:hypothetical protein